MFPRGRIYATPADALAGMLKGIKLKAKPAKPRK
jgi:hypothetical protein